MRPSWTALLAARVTLSLARGLAQPAACASAMSQSAKVPFIKAAAAAELDGDLMAAPGFSLDQLMELAGLSVAAAVEKHFPVDKFPRVLAVCGPGNNGGDGLVAARHLTHFGYSVTVVLPKLSTRHPIFTNLCKQLRDLDVAILAETPTVAEITAGNDVLIDAVFGFSFAGDVRPPFDQALEAMRGATRPILSVDVPSGWDVDKGNIAGIGVEPDVLVSLTAPKLCARGFSGAHYLGGRFVPPAIVSKYGLQGLPKFPGAEQIVRIA